MQRKWAEENLPGYDGDLAPTVTIEAHVHSIITSRQMKRAAEREAKGIGKWTSTLQKELENLVEDFRAAGFSENAIKEVLEQ